MLIIVDKKIPEKGKEKLRSIAGEYKGTLIEFETHDLVYPAISGHPDIFFCQTPQALIVSPDLPSDYLSILKTHHVPFIQGNFPVSQDISAKEIIRQFPELAKEKSRRVKFVTGYNAAMNDHYLVHRLEFTDPVILENCHYLKKISVTQGYTRCNLVLLKDDHYITSDHGIHETLKRSGMQGIAVDPAGIILPGFPNGFIGGAMGIFENKVFILGSLQFFREGKIMGSFLIKLGYQIVELFDEPLFDGGGILFI